MSQLFLHCESSEKIKCVLKSTTEIVTDGEVYYKRNDSKEWYGPGVVIEHDGNLVLVYQEVYTSKFTLIAWLEIGMLIMILC